MADKHLEVLAGGAGEEFHGIGEQPFIDLAKRVDRICYVSTEGVIPLLDSSSSNNDDGLPVDVVASTVVGVATSKHSDCRAFNINNYHDDGNSFDSFTHWIETAGYTLTKIDSYQQWYDRFKEKLTTLPEDQKQHSALEILGAFEKQNQLGSGMAISCDNFKLLAKALFPGDLPHIDEAFIHKCLADMQHLGLIERVSPSNQGVEIGDGTTG